MRPASHPLLARLAQAARRRASGARGLDVPGARGTATDWARIERALKRQEIAEEAAHVGTFEADLETAKITITPEVARLHEIDPSRLVLSVPEFLAAIHREDRDRLLGLVGERGDFTVDYRYGCPNGLGSRILEISGRWLPGDRPDHPGYFIGVERDVTEQRAQEAQLRQLALHDPLTGALNRRGFEQLLARHAAERTATGTGAGCLLMIDLDDFKHHNDTYGHAVGDEILIAIADALQARLAPGDAAGRIGGDEFVVLLPGRTTREATVVADDLLGAIAGAAHRVSPDPDHPVTASIGVAALTDDEDPTLVLRRADEAMYAAKSGGGSRAVRWSKHSQPTGGPSAGTDPVAAGLTDIDPATGLPGRRGLLTLMTRRIAESEEAASSEDPTRLLAMYIIDLCGIELLAEGPGLDAREGLVRTLARRFRDLGDAAAPVGVLGDGRVAVLVPVADAAECHTIAERVEGWLAELWSDEIAVPVVPLIGVATWSPGTDAYTLLQNATIALTRARISGPGAVRHYDADLRAWAMDRATTHVALRRGVARKEFRLVHQPVLDLRSGLFERTEALVRWQPPSGVAIGPDRFIPLAEDTGLILPLGEQIMDMAIAQALAWREEGRYVRTSVNLSGVELTTPGFADRLLERLGASGLEAKWFTFEVTESALIDNLAAARDALQRLYDAGYRVVLDDFGTGHSSLARLWEIPSSGLKIDMALIQRLSRDPAARTVVNAIVDIGHAYGMTVTAEGIEDAETLSIVRDLGVDFAQGYYLSRPKAAAELTELLRRPWAEEAEVNAGR